MSRSRPLAPLALAPLAALTLAGCVASTPGEDTRTVAVDSSATACTVSATRAPSGTLTFAVTNSGQEVTEFYLLGSDGQTVIGEAEDIGPGLTRNLVVQVSPGDYVTACKPGMAGEGIRAPFTVTGSGATTGTSGTAGAADDELAAAEAAYLDYVTEEVSTLVAGTKDFADAYAAGHDDAARALYAPTRVHWERIEPVAESFGDLDPHLDAREADLADGEEWSGWHLIEKDLWPPAAAANGGEQYTSLTADQRAAAADRLVDLTGELHDRVTADGFSFAAFRIANGAKELLDEVATGKVTGEEEIWSHTDLWDFQANVEGARKALEDLRQVARQADPALVAELDARFDALLGLLATHGSIETGFTAYDALTAGEVTALAAAVDAVAEPLSHLTATVTGA